MTGLPRKYAKMGFKKGWKAYRKIKNRSKSRSRSRSRSRSKPQKRRSSYMAKRRKSSKNYNKPNPLKKVWKVLVGITVGVATVAVYEKWISPKIPMGSKKNLIEGALGVVIASGGALLGAPVAVGAIAAGSTLAAWNALQGIVGSPTSTSVARTTTTSSSGFEKR